MPHEPKNELQSSLRQPEGKEIKLKKFLPDHLEQSEVGDFIGLFEDFLNELYYHEISATGTLENWTTDADGNKTYFQYQTTSAGNIVTSANPDGYGTVSATSAIDNPAHKISILEKAKRIADLKNPNLVDIEFIQRIANFMGYNVNVHRSNITDLTSAVSISDETNQYLRFVVSNLPNWYQIKSTRNAVKVLFYSFGLVGDLIYRWTTDKLSSSTNHPELSGYGNDPSFWREEDPNDTTTSSVGQLPEHWFPTPHFIVRVNANRTPATWIEDIDNIVKAVESIRPINDVFDTIQVIFQQTLETIYVRMDSYHMEKVVWAFNEDFPPIPVDPTGTGDLDTGFVVVAGTGQKGHDGSGALIMPEITLSGTGQKGHDGSGALIMPVILLSGSGDVAQTLFVESGSAPDIYIESGEAGDLIVEDGP